MSLSVLVVALIAFVLVLAAGVVRIFGALELSRRLAWAGIAAAAISPFIVTIELWILDTVGTYWYLFYPGVGVVILAIVVKAKLRLNARLAAVAKAFPSPKTSMKERLSGEE